MDIPRPSHQHLEPEPIQQSSVLSPDGALMENPTCLITQYSCLALHNHWNTAHQESTVSAFAEANLACLRSLGDGRRDMREARSYSQDQMQGRPAGHARQRSVISPAMQLQRRSLQGHRPLISHTASKNQPSTFNLAVTLTHLLTPRVYSPFLWKGYLTTGPGNPAPILLCSESTVKGKCPQMPPTEPCTPRSQGSQRSPLSSI